MIFFVKLKEELRKVGRRQVAKLALYLSVFFLCQKFGQFFGADDILLVKETDGNVFFFHFYLLLP